MIPADWLTAFNIVSSVGQFFGGFACSAISDRMGRKKSLTLGVLVVTGGIMGESFSSTRAAFVVSKLILGVGVGFYLTLGPITCSEIAPTVLRGLSTAGVNLAIAVGQLISNSVTSGFGNRDDVWAFRGPFLAQLIFSVFLFIGSFLSPESPWYLVRAGKTEEARLVLQDLYGSEFEALEKLQAIQQTVEEEATMASSSYISAFKGTDRVRTLISIGVFACQHAVGIIFVLSFSTYFFQLAGLDTQKSLNLGVGVTACGVAGNICSWFIVNRFGRRPIFVTGMFACTIILLLIGILDVVPTGAAKWAMSSLTVVFSFVYFLTIGAVAFVLLGEVSSLSQRARTTALATATQAIFGIIMFFAVPYMVNPDAGVSFSLPLHDPISNCFRTLAAKSALSLVDSRRLLLLSVCSTSPSLKDELIRRSIQCFIAEFHCAKWDLIVYNYKMRPDLFYILNYIVKAIVMIFKELL